MGIDPREYPFAGARTARHLDDGIGDHGRGGDPVVERGIAIVAGQRLSAPDHRLDGGDLIMALVPVLAEI